MDSELLKLRIPNAIYRVAQILEIIVSLFVIAAIALSLVSVAHELGLMASEPANSDALQAFLATAFTVVARQMVIEHTTAVENLIMVISIGILFIIRKYLFIPDLDNRPSNIFRVHSHHHTEDPEHTAKP